MRALLGTASHFCKVVVLRLRTPLIKQVRVGGVEQGEGGAEAGSNADPLYSPHLVAASTYHKHSVGPSIRPVCTRCCFTRTNMIQVSSKFHCARMFIINARPDGIRQVQVGGVEQGKGMPKREAMQTYIGSRALLTRSRHTPCSLQDPTPYVM